MTTKCLKILFSSLNVYYYLTYFYNKSEKIPSKMNAFSFIGKNGSTNSPEVTQRVYIRKHKIHYVSGSKVVGGGGISQLFHLQATLTNFFFQNGDL